MSAKQIAVKINNAAILTALHAKGADSARVIAVLDSWLSGQIEQCLTVQVGKSINPASVNNLLIKIREIEQGGVAIANTSRAVRGKSQQSNSGALFEYAVKVAELCLGAVYTVSTGKFVFDNTSVKWSYNDAKQRVLWDLWQGAVLYAVNDTGDKSLLTVRCLPFADNSIELSHVEFSLDLGKTWLNVRESLIDGKFESIGEGLDLPTQISVQFRCMLDSSLAVKEYNKKGGAFNEMTAKRYSALALANSKMSEQDKSLDYQVKVKNGVLPASTGTFDLFSEMEQKTT